MGARALTELLNRSLKRAFGAPAESVHLTITIGVQTT